MMQIILFFVFWLFVFGLLQWARGGDGLWKIFSLRHGLQNRKKRSLAEKEDVEKELRDLEGATDSMLKSSLRVLGLLAVCAWLLVGLTFLLDVFGVNWAHRITTHASSYWKAATPGAFDNRAAKRNDMIRNLGTGVK